MLSEKEKKVLQLIDASKEELVQYLRKLISFKTITPPGDGKAESDDYKKLQNSIRKNLEEMGFTIDMWEVDAAKLKNFPGSGIEPTKDLSNMPVVVGTLKGHGKGKSLILNGHYDVVPVGVIENWKHDPFGGEIQDNKLFGRGACDMKGGIASMLAAVKSIKQAGINLAGDLIVQTAPEEEMTCMGTLACCQKGYTANAAIIPEPTNLDILIAMRGNASGKVTVFGRAGHADEGVQPHWSEGGAVNAISKSVKILQALEELTEEWKTRPDKQHKLLNPDMVMPTIIRGGEWLIMYPEKVEIEFNADFIPSTVNMGKEIEEKIKSVAATDPWMKEHPPKVEGGYMYGAEIDENEPIIATASEAARELNIQPKLVGIDSMTDAVHLINYSRIPTISIGAGGGTAHKADEFVDIAQLISATKIIALAILRWCGYS